jgi:hypothetical protein
MFSRTTQNQEDGKDGISITIPTTIPTSFPSGNAVIRMIFDATVRNRWIRPAIPPY